MAIVNGSLQEGYKDAAWFAANPTLVLLVGQKVNLEQTGTYKLGDGTTQLSALSFLGGSGSGLSGLTTNKVLKATSSTTAGDSNITDDGTTVTVNSPTVITSDNSNNQIISIDNLKALVAHDVKILFNSPIYSFANMQANETVETDASKNLVSVAKGTGYNLALGTIAGTVLEGDKGLLIANNLSDLNNAITARTTNLKMYDMFLTNGDQTTTSNVAANITDLVSPTLTANKRYKISGIIKIACNNSGGVRIQITLPTSATMFVDLTGSATSGYTVSKTFLNASSTLISPALCTFNGVNGSILVNGEIQLSSTAGVVQFGFASNTNTQTTTVYQLGTQLTLTQIN